MAKTDGIIRLDYWKYFPERVLLSEKVHAMTARQMGAYWLIVSRAMMESLPGVIPFDEEKLAKWGTLTAKEWEKDRLAILAPFTFHPPTGTLHHEFVKGLYTEHCNFIQRQRRFGSKGAAKRYDSSEKATDSPPLGGLYDHFKPPFFAICKGNLAELVEVARKALISSISIGGLQPPHSKVGTTKVPTTTTQPCGESAPLEAGGSRTGSEISTPPAAAAQPAPAAAPERQPLSSYIRKPHRAEVKS